MIVPGRGVTPITAAHDLRPTYGTPQGADEGVQLGEPDRLGQVVVRARLQPDDDVHLVGAGGQHHHHRGGLQRAQPPTHLDPVEIGKAEVEQHEIDRSRPGRESAAPRALPLHFVSVATQAGVQRVADRLVVLHHQ